MDYFKLFDGLICLMIFFTDFNKYYFHSFIGGSTEQIQEVRPEDYYKRE